MLIFQEILILLTEILWKRLTSGSYNIAFNNNSCKASVASAEIKNNSVYNYVFNLNDSYAFSFLHPKPAFRNISNDSALTIWEVIILCIQQAEVMQSE